MTPRSFAVLSALLHRASGLVIGPEKQYLLETRLAPIMRAHGLAGLDALAERLDAPGISRAVVEAMTTNESFFFRDDKPFAHVRETALPRLHAARPAGARLRIWSAASSAGQEAYSLAMIVDELRPVLGGREVEIIGTDLSGEQVRRARDGLYSQFEVQRGLPRALLARHFRREGGQWRISPALRGMVSFREWNLLDDPGALGVFDLVFCRNVLIYFDRATKTRVLEAIARRMPADGLLYLGGAETVLGLTDGLEMVAGAHGVYGRAAPALAQPALAMAGGGQ